VIEVLEQGYESELSDQDIAIQVGEALNKAYPHHPWIVGFQGHNIVIRHMAIADCVHVATGKQGFAAALPQSKLRTPKEIVRSAVMMGGQLLEAFGLPRAAWDGRDPVCPNWDESTPYKRKAWQ
jgi:hypothetical protein